MLGSIASAAFKSCTASWISPAAVVDPATQLQPWRGCRLEREDFARAALGFIERALAEVDAGFPVLQIRVAQRRVQPGVVADNREPVVQELYRVIDRVLPPTPGFLARPQIALVGVHVHDGTVGQPPVFVGGEPELQGVHDDTGEAFLYREDVGDRPVILVGPHVVVGGGIDQLSGDPQPIAGSAHAAFQDVPHASSARSS